MIFRIKLNTLYNQNGHPSQINASMYCESADDLKSHLGTFRYYHFLRDFFETFSTPFRRGEIGFCKPGLGDLCISWDLPGAMKVTGIREAIIEGISKVSKTNNGSLWNKYSLSSRFSFDLPSGNELNSYSRWFQVDFEEVQVSRSAV